MTLPDAVRLLDGFADAFVVADERNEIVYANAAAGRLLDYDMDALIGRPLSMIMPARLRAAHDEGFRRFFATRQSRMMGRPIRVPVLSRTGTEIDIELTLSTMNEGGRVCVVASLRDLRERVELERELATARNQAAQYRVATTLLEAASLEDGLARSLHELCSTLEFSAGVAWLLDDGALRVAGTWHEPEPTADAYIAASRARWFAPGEGLPGSTLTAGKASVLQDLWMDPRFVRRDEAKTAGFRAALFFPIFGRRTVIGVYEVLARGPIMIDDAAAQSFETLGRQVGQFVERTRAEDARARSEERLKTTLMSIGDGVVVTDAQLRIVMMNPVAESLIGHTQVEAVGRPLHDVFRIVDEASRDVVESPAQRAIDEGAIGGLASHTVLIAKDGSERAIADSAAPVRARDGALEGVVLVFRDESERRRSERRQQALAAAADLLRSVGDAEDIARPVVRAVVPHVADWCSVVLGDDPAAPRAVVVGHADESKVGPANELRRRYPPAANAPHGVPHVLRTKQPELYPVVDEAVLRATARDEEHFRILQSVGMRSAMVVPLIARGILHGAMTLVSSRESLTYDQDDLAFAMDLAGRCAQALETARLLAALGSEVAALAEAKAALQERERDLTRAIEMRDDFIATAAHELRTPLSTLRLTVEATMRGMQKQPQATSSAFAEKIAAAERQCARMEVLVERLLHVAKATAGQIPLEVKELNLASVVNDVIERVKTSTSGDASAISVAGPSHLMGAWDRVRVEQILTNLLTNALRYAERTPIRVSFQAVDDLIRIVVKDEGPGVPKEAQARIFERFERAVADPATTGFGLGLWITRRFAEDQGGRIELESEPGQGASFVVTLPQRVGLPAGVPVGSLVPA